MVFVGDCIWSRIRILKEPFKKLLLQNNFLRIGRVQLFFYKASLIFPVKSKCQIVWTSIASSSHLAWRGTSEITPAGGREWLPPSRYWHAHLVGGISIYTHMGCQLLGFTSADMEGWLCLLYYTVLYEDHAHSGILVSIEAPWILRWQ